MNIAVIENGIVENIIVCETVKLAKELTGKDCVEILDDNPAHIGLGFDGTEFEQPVDEVDDLPTDSEQPSTVCFRWGWLQDDQSCL